MLQLPWDPLDPAPPLAFILAALGAELAHGPPPIRALTCPPPVRRA